METKTLLFGFMPPALALLAELYNPISRSELRRLAIETAKQFVEQDGRPSSDVEAEQNAIAAAMSATAIGTARVSALIPTWIGVTTALSSVMAEILNDCALVACLALWVSLWTAPSIKFFARLDYYAVGHDRGASHWLYRGSTRADSFSRIVILLNLCAMLVVIGAWCSPYVIPVCISVIDRLTALFARLSY